MNYAYEITNWSEYQYYSKRNPPWICLHYEILTSEMWVMSSDKSRVLAIACMLVASRHDGKIPDNASYLRRAAYLDFEPDFSELVSCGFLTDLRDLHADECSMHASACNYVSVSDMSSNKKRERKREQFSKEAEEVLEHLALTTGRRFTNDREIKACFNREACTVEDCKKVITSKWFQWKDGDMAKHVNPVTPFRAKHFQAYLDEANAGPAMNGGGFKPKTKEEEFEEMVREMEEGNAES